MADIRSKIYEIYSLEQLSAGRSCIHSLHPLPKLLGCAVYIVCVVSFSRYDIARLVPYIFYPVLLMALAGIPFGMILKRTLVALPFCLLAGLSNVILDRAAMFRLGGITVSFGVASFFTILFRTLLCVAAVLILVAVTTLPELTAQLRRLRIPGILVSLFEMTYRYIGVLLEEASTMYTAYRLRSRTKKGLEMRHMGFFVGQLLLRSVDRAERVYHAMKCRGYGLGDSYRTHRALAGPDVLFLALTCGLSVLFRLVDFHRLFASIVGRLL
jgi:cobalt/nickel transport system permease protein